MLIISLIVGVLAVARVTRLLVEDRIASGYRRWVVNKWGPQSMPTYLAHCSWCTSIWVAALIMPWAVLAPTTLTVALLAIPAASYVTGVFADWKE